MRKHSNSQSGFSLLELLLYISIASVLLFAVGTSSQAFLEARIKNQVIADVNNGGASAMNIILQTVRNAESITAPGAGSAANTLTLAMADSSKNPTEFRLSSEKLQIKEGAGDWTDLTNLDKVLVSVVGVDAGIFSNFSRSATPGIIRVRFNMAHAEPAGTNQYFQGFNADFQGAASLR